ncbi:MAG: rod-binding protein [Pirellulales bacterium]
MEIGKPSLTSIKPADFAGIARGLNQQSGSDSAAQSLLNAHASDELDLSHEAQQVAASQTESADDGTAPRDAISKKKGEGESLKDVFQDFVGRTFFSELIKSLRSTQQGSAYMNGGRAEEIFQGQLDQVLTDHLSDASAASISDPMLEQVQRGRGM